MISKSRWFLVLLFFGQLMLSQSIEIYGKVTSRADVENIHVINNTAKFFTVTNSKGEFQISAKLNDTLLFSSIQHKPTYIVINKSIIMGGRLMVRLNEQLNELDEVLVGKVLTGDLLADINGVEGDPPINFYDVGIPGYKGRKATQSERRLYTAGEFKPIMLLGLLGGSLSLDPIINGISGRTKKLKQRVKLESSDNLLRKIKSSLTKDFFSIYELNENLRTDFFYFCQESSDFNKRCKGKTDFEIWEFLKEKLVIYKKT